MDSLAGLKFVGSALFGTFYGIPLFILGLAISIAWNVWARSRWLRNVYWVFVVVGSLPFLALASLPMLTGLAPGPDIRVVYLLYFLVISPFSAGVLFGAMVAPLYR